MVSPNALAPEDIASSSILGTVEDEYEAFIALPQQIPIFALASNFPAAATYQLMESENPILTRSGERNILSLLA